MDAPDRSIEVEGLVRHFKGGIVAVDGIDLSVRSGEIYGFLGPNGAGKSTTVKILTTLLPPTSGKATVGGIDVFKEGHKVRQIVGAALQEVALDPHLTGREHLNLQAALQGIGRRERKERAAALLTRVGLSEAADRKVRGYSGGMKRRLDLALALVHGPKILFLDEPTTGLDIQSRHALWNEMRALRESGVTILLTTQYLEEADTLADRIGIIDHGKIVAEGTPAELKASIGRPTVVVTPKHESSAKEISGILERFGELQDGSPGSISIRLGTNGGLADIVRALDSVRMEIEDLALHAPSLDDVFLAKTGRSLEGGGPEAAQEDIA
jgi:ABC-2 type transport system ATP-binding protein